MAGTDSYELHKPEVVIGLCGWIKCAGPEECAETQSHTICTTRLFTEHMCPAPNKCNSQSLSSG